MVRVGLTHKKHGSGHGSKKNRVRVKKKSGLGQVFFGSGQKILTRFAMSLTYSSIQSCSPCYSTKKIVTMLKVLKNYQKVLDLSLNSNI